MAAVGQVPITAAPQRLRPAPACTGWVGCLRLAWGERSPRPPARPAACCLIFNATRKRRVAYDNCPLPRLQPCACDFPGPELETDTVSMQPDPRSSISPLCYTRPSLLNSYSYYASHPSTLVQLLFSFFLHIPPRTSCRWRALTHIPRHEHTLPRPLLSPTRQHSLNQRRRRHR